MRARARAAWLAMLVATSLTALVACDRRAPIDSCQDSLAGTWVNERRAGERAGSEERWAILDRGKQIEIFPLFDDTAAGAAEDARNQLVRSPRSLELLRSNSSLLGHVERWVMRDGKKCVLRGNAKISNCKRDGRGATLDAQIVALPVPLSDFDLEVCLPGPRGLPRQAERWRRVD